MFLQFLRLHLVIFAKYNFKQPTCYKAIVGPWSILDLAMITLDQYYDQNKFCEHEPQNYTPHTYFIHKQSSQSFILINNKKWLLNTLDQQLDSKNLVYNITYELIASESTINFKRALTWQSSNVCPKSNFVSLKFSNLVNENVTANVI